jgi:hypothetical protein
MRSVQLPLLSPFALTLVLALLAFGCTPQSLDGAGPDAPPLDEPLPDDDEPITDDDEPITDDDDTTDIDDDDDDTGTDDDDSNPDEDFISTWPDEIDLQTTVAFEPNEIALAFDVGPCSLSFGGVLLREAADTCPGCDLEYAGAVLVASSDCPEDYIATPEYRRFAFVFLDEQQRELWRLDDEEGWLLVGLIQSNNTSWESVRNEAVLYDVPLLGETEVGNFVVTDILTDL